MSTEKAVFGEEPIPIEVSELINEYVEESVRLIKEEDLDTAEFYLVQETEFRTYQYKFLRWLKKTERLNKVLYAGSGYDDLPKHVLGEDKVVHTSLEKYKGDPEEYFPLLGKGEKVVAENKELPFAESTFGAVLFFGLSEEIISEQIPDAIRTLKPGGVIVFGSSMLCEINIDELDGFERVEVPDEYESAGESEAKFLVFRKLAPIVEMAK